MFLYHVLQPANPGKWLNREISVSKPMPIIPRQWFSDRNIIQEIAAGNICQEFTVAKKCLSRNAAQVFCRQENSALVLACQEAFAVKDNQADVLSVKTCSDRNSQLRSITLLLSARRQNIFKEEFCVTILSHQFSKDITSCKWQTV